MPNNICHRDVLSHCDHHLGAMEQTKPQTRTENKREKTGVKLEAEACLPFASIKTSQYNSFLDLPSRFFISDS